MLSRRKATVTVIAGWPGQDGPQLRTGARTISKPNSRQFCGLVRILRFFETDIFAKDRYNTSGRAHPNFTVSFPDVSTRF